MSGYNHILNWELLAGSHDFPGPDGGTCINEAAIIAAGFQYQKVKDFRDPPICFCPILGGTALVINDMVGHEARQRLLPLVTRFAGSKDVSSVEKERFRIMKNGAIGAFHSVLKEVSAHKLRNLFPSSYYSSIQTEISKMDSLLEHQPVGENWGAVSALNSWNMLCHNFRGLFYGNVFLDFNGMDYRFAPFAPLWENAFLDSLFRAFAVGKQASEADVAQVADLLEGIKQEAKDRQLVSA